jgi:hypothetical protein
MIILGSLLGVAAVGAVTWFLKKRNASGSESSKNVNDRQSYMSGDLQSGSLPMAVHQYEAPAL